MNTAVRGLAVAGLTVVLLLVAGPVFAHVAVETDNARPGAVGVLKVHVPNESDTADTVEVALQLPDGFAFVGAKDRKGWRITAEGDVVTIAGGTIPPGASADFRLRVRNSTEKGTYPFPAIQTYSDDERVRWTGEEGSDSPAPVLVVEGKPVAVKDEPAEAVETTSPEPASPAPASPTATEPAESPAADTAERTGGALLPTLVIAALGAIGAAVVLRRSNRRR